MAADGATWVLTASPEVRATTTQRLHAAAGIPA
jgi:hypothetical protein